MIQRGNSLDPETTEDIVQPVADGSFTHRCELSSGVVEQGLDTSRALLLRLGRAAKHYDQRLCQYVCPLAYLKNHASKFHQIFYSCYLWPWLGSFSDRGTICYLLPGLCMTSCFYIMGNRPDD